VLQFLYVVFFITTALYPVVSQTIFQSFLCQQLEPPTCEPPAGGAASQVSECAFPAGENPDGGFLFSAWSAEECAARADLILDPRKILACGGQAAPLLAPHAPNRRNAPRRTSTFSALGLGTSGERPG
jgi:hypothetical protein